MANAKVFSILMAKAEPCYLSIYLCISTYKITERQSALFLFKVSRNTACNPLLKFLPEKKFFLLQTHARCVIPIEVV